MSREIRSTIGTALMNLRYWYLFPSTQLMIVPARACGHRKPSEFNAKDLTSWKKEVADLAGIRYAGVSRGNGRSLRHKTKTPSGKKPTETT